MSLKNTKQLINNSFNTVKKSLSSFSPNSFNQLFHNKYVYYILIFVALANFIAYMYSKRVKELVVFLCLGFFVYHFSNNIPLTLLSCIVFTSLISSFVSYQEGMQNNVKETVDKMLDEDTDSKLASELLDETKNVAIAKDVLAKTKQTNLVNSNKLKQAKDTLDSKLVDPNNTDLNNNTTTDQPEGFGNNISKKTDKNNKSPRLDYASTLDEAYRNLDNALGSDSIQQLTSDTQKLMKQQQNLFQTMNQMMPVLEGAQNMLKGFNIKGLTGSLESISSSLKK
jgi:hypothetical protein